MSPNGKEQYIFVDDILNNNQPEPRGGASDKIISIEEVFARRDATTHTITANTAKSIKEWCDHLKVSYPANLLLDAKVQDISLWRVKSPTETHKIITGVHHSTAIALKDKIPIQQPVIQDSVADGVVFFENDLRLSDNRIFLHSKRSYWVEDRGKKYRKTDSLLTRAIDLNAFSFKEMEAPKNSVEGKNFDLTVDEDGLVKSAQGESILKLKQISEQALAWALPDSKYFLIARKDLNELGSITILECVDRTGTVLSRANCGEFLDICYFPRIAFSPDKSAFALFGYGQKNHAAPVKYFKIKMDHGKPMVTHIPNVEESLFSDAVSLDFYPYVLHLKPQSVVVTRFDSNQIVSQWGNDPNPGYSSGDTVFATDVKNKALVVLEGEKMHLLRLGNNGSILSTGTLKYDALSLTFFTPDNHFIQRGDSTKGVHFVRGFQAYPFEQFDLRLNRPDIVLERLGAPDEAIAIAKQLREKRLKRMGVTEDMLQPDFHLPEIEVVGDLPSSTEESELALKIKASDSKYPLDRLRVYVNNVPVNGKEGELLRDAKSQSLERTIPIKLAAGRNKIQVSVLNSAGAESLYANAEVACTAQRPKPTLYAVAMGVSEYANPEWNLKYAAKDAQDILERVNARSGSSYGEIKELLLTDREATKESLGKIREFLSTATVDDTVLMFVAGHGLLDSKYDYYFGTADIDFNNPKFGS